MFIFHKTEIQTVILRCLPSLNLNWYKSYDIKHKNAKNTKTASMCFCTKLQKKRSGNICIFCHNFYTNHNLDLFNTSKWPSESQFCERWTYIWQKLARGSLSKVIYKGTFISNQSLLYLFSWQWKQFLDYLPGKCNTYLFLSRSLLNVP